MFRILMLTALCIGSSLMSVTAAAVPALDEVVAAVQAPFRSETPAAQRISDYRADFVQESQIVSLNRTQEARGQVVVDFSTGTAGDAAEVRFRWEYLEPSRQLIVADGRTVWVYIPENNQVIRTQTEELARNRENDPLTFLTGLSHLSRDFEVAWAEPQVTEDGHYRLELQPRREAALVARLLMIIDRRAVPSERGKSASTNAQAPLFPVRAVTIIDANGNRSQIRFENSRVNTGTGEDLFQFTVPEGVDVMSPADAGLNF